MTEVRKVPKANQFDEVVLTEPIAGFARGEVGAVVEVYTAPYEAYDVEIVTDEGVTKGLLSAVRPDQIEVTAASTSPLKFASIQIEQGDTTAAVSFSDGKQVRVHADDLYALAA